MVEITYHKQYNRVTITGHAQSGEYGQDLVCSAVSILAYTLAQSVQDLYGAGKIEEPTTRMDEGDTEIQCRPLTAYRAVVKLVYQTVINGWELLSAAYPGSVKLTVLG